MVVDTSLEAYEMIKSLLSQRQEEVLRVFVKHKDKSFTNRELAKELGWDINRVTPRTLELRKMGILKTVGKRDCGVTGNTAYAIMLRSNKQ